MCTVTIYYKGNNDFVLTSNRDEAPNRKSIPPNVINENSTTMLFPKDELAGGTWIGVSEKNRLICLLNGGFVKHHRKDSYQFSRGVIVKDLLASDDVEASIKNYNFINVEPFTIVVADWNTYLRFFELVWDGKEAHFNKLPLNTKIWSSSTLYSDNMKRERHQCFEDFKTHNKLNAKTLLDFHSSESENKDFGIVMDRGFVKTTSITQVEKTNDKLSMNYFDLQQDKRTITNFISPIALNE